MNPTITISKRLSSFDMDVALGIISGDVSVKKGNAALDTLIESCVTENCNIATADICKIPKIDSSRSFYRAIGQDPSRYRISSEALLRRIAQGKGLYRINNVVDINNIVSIKTHFSVGSYDLANIAPPVTFDIGNAGESYQGIGKGAVNIENLPIFRDGDGPFGSPTSDSQRAMITPKTTSLMMVVISFSGIDGVKEATELGMNLLQENADGINLECEIVV
ncbi:MAG: hypothetical protein HN337_10095 [Deltaproteobacteria bacterium]|jgi:DNA/RNA-binding domain of Phe-tRNA-synthetase-like protein|nr:hypothetical protein [Deltaproteobacteria bacterium]